MSLRTLWAATLLLAAGGVGSQVPPVGRLVISSDPPGATVTINGNPMDQHTNATFTVSAGTYTVSVASADGGLRCPEKSVPVSPGQTVSYTCSAGGWR